MFFGAWNGGDLQDGPIEVLESTEGIKTVIRCVTRFGVPGGDWRPVMQAVVTNSKLHLDPAIADDIGPGEYVCGTSRANRFELEREDGYEEFKGGQMEMPIRPIGSQAARKVAR